jgi:hypothetical protein
MSRSRTETAERDMPDTDRFDPTRIPHTLHVEAVQRPGTSDWTYRVRYDDLAGSVVEDHDIHAALARLDAMVLPPPTAAEQPRDPHGGPQ